MGKKGYIIAEGSYPVGSMSLRVRMWAKGFIANNISIRLLIVSPPPTKTAIENSEDFVHFCFKPILKINKTLKLPYLFYRIIGVVKLFNYINKNNVVDFVLLSRPNTLIGLILLFFIKKKNIKLFIDKGDESGILIDKKIKTLNDYFSKYNHMIFNKYILPKVDVLFVVSSYLENKFKNEFPKLKIKRSLPTLINWAEFQNLQKNNIFEIKQNNMNIFNSNKLKIFYAGSCERTNGLFFFLEIAAKVLNERMCDFEIIFIFVDGDVDKVKEFCSKLNITNHVSFLNPVLPQYMPAIYTYVDILILPEQGDIIANAGFPGKTGEYLASGKAILSTIFSDLTDYLKYEVNAMLANIGDKEKYFDNLIRLLNDKELRIKLGENAQKTAQEEFDYKQGMLRFIDEI